MGQEMGLWNHGFDFPRFATQLFGDIDFRDKTMLEIGCGKGMLCLWAALHGAETVGLEPMAEGCYDSSECHQAFKVDGRETDLPQATDPAADSPGFSQAPRTTLTLCFPWLPSTIWTKKAVLRFSTRRTLFRVSQESSAILPP